MDDTAFSATCVDEMGALYTKNIFYCDAVEEYDMYEWYVILCTCASTRDTVLDLVMDTSSKQFIYGFQ